MSSKKPSKPLAFIVMPFSKAVSKSDSYRPLDYESLETVFSVIKSILSRRYIIRRAESASDILRDIVLDLDRAELVIADLTSLNPNVMYELGIRHGFCKKTILLTQDRSELPFDIAGYHCIEYGWITNREKAKFREDLLAQLKLLDTGEDVRHGPVHAHLGAKLLGVEDVEYESVLRKLRSLVAELGSITGMIQRGMRMISKELPAKASLEEGIFALDWSKLSESEAKTVVRYMDIPISLPSVDLFIAENYVPTEFDQHNEVFELLHMLLTLKQYRSRLASYPASTISHILDLLARCQHRVVQIYIAIDTRQPDLKITEIDPFYYDELLKVFTRDGFGMEEHSAQGNASKQDEGARELAAELQELKTSPIDSVDSFELRRDMAIRKLRALHGELGMLLSTTMFVVDHITKEMKQYSNENMRENEGHLDWENVSKEDKERILDAIEPPHSMAATDHYIAEGYIDPSYGGGIGPSLLLHELLLIQNFRKQFRFFNNNPVVILKNLLLSALDSICKLVVVIASRHPDLDFQSIELDEHKSVLSKAGIPGF